MSFENNPNEKEINEEKQVFLNFLSRVERFLYREYLQSLLENFMNINNHKKK